MARSSNTSFRDSFTGSEVDIDEELDASDVGGDSCPSSQQQTSVFGSQEAKVKFEKCQLSLIELFEEAAAKKSDSPVKRLRNALAEKQKRDEARERGSAAIGTSDDHLALDLLEQKVNLGSYLTNSESIGSVHPGEKILDLSSVPLVRQDREKVIASSRNKRKANNTWGRKLLPVLAELSLLGVDLQEFENLDDKCAIQRLFYKMAFSHNEYMLGCLKQILLTLLTDEHGLTIHISVNELLQVLINFGATLEVLLPAPELRIAVDSILKARATTELSEVGLLSEGMVCHCLEAVVNVLCFVVRSPDWLASEAKHASVLIVLLCSLALDVHFRTSDVILEIKRCVDFLLSAYEDQHWPSEMLNLAQNLTSLSDHHHNLLFVAQLFGYSKRGTSLCQCTAYLMVHKIYGKSVHLECADDVTPKAVLKFVLSISLKPTCTSDLYSFYNTVILLDLCILQPDLKSSSCEAIETLARIMKKMSGGIKDTITCLDGSKVKDVISRTCIRWTQLVSCAPVTQKTLFGYVKKYN